MQIDDVTAMRVRGISEAAARARLAFFIMLFACGALVTALYNNYFTWNRLMLAENRGMTVWPVPSSASGVRDPEPRADLPPDERNEWRKELAEIKAARAKERDDARQARNAQTASNIADYQDITISWLGIKFSSGDADVLGALGLFVTSMYYLLCVRRMALETETLLHDVGPNAALDFEDKAVLRQDVNRRAAIYLGVRQSYVLDSVVDADLATELTNRSASGRMRQDFGLRLISGLFPVMTFLPLFTLMAAIVSDWVHLVIQIGSDHPGPWWWLTNLTREFRTQFVVMHLFALVMAVLIWRLNLTTYQFARNTSRAMSTFATNLQRDEQRLRQ